MTESFEQNCIVELFGHQIIAGKVTEQVIGGQPFIRVGVPEVDEKHPAFTKFYGHGAIYCMTPCDEATALAAIKGLQIAPINIYALNIPRLLENND